MNNKIIIAVIVIVVIIGGWYGLSMNSGSENATLGTSSADGVLNSQVVTENNDDSEVLKLLLDMRTIKLDDTIFQNPAFNVLKDTGQQIIPEPVGRKNPFAPVGNDDDVISEEIPVQFQGRGARTGVQEEISE